MNNRITGSLAAGLVYINNISYTYMKVDHIFIVHYKPLTQRKEYITKKFQEMDITNYTFYEEYDRNTTSKEVMDTYFKLANLNPAQICITIAHLEIYRIIVEKQLDNCLILEDDAIFCDKFKEHLEWYMNELPHDYDLAFLTDGCDLHPPNIVPNKLWYRVTTSRTCCGYVINRKTCDTMLKHSIPFTMAIDWELNLQIAAHNLVTYWSEPAIIHHGSGNIYDSSYVQF